MVGSEAKQAAFEWLVKEHLLSQRQASQTVKVSRSTQYRKAKRNDDSVKEALNQIVDKHPRWGFWKCFERIRGQGYQWNHKRVYRVYCLMRLNLPRRTKKRLPARVVQPLNQAQKPNQIWAMDFMSDRVAHRSFRTFNVMDEATRQALTIEVGTSMPSSRVVRHLNELIEIYGKPQALRCDNGPEFISQNLVDWAEKNGIELKYIQPGKPNQNALIERFNRSFREEVLNCHLFNTLQEVQEITQQWIHLYNHERPHDALGCLTPAQFGLTFNSLHSQLVA